MSDLEQVRAENLELMAEVERYRDALNTLSNWLVMHSFTTPEDMAQSFGAMLALSNETLSRQIPYGAGELILVLAKASKDVRDAWGTLTFKSTPETDAARVNAINKACFKLFQLWSFLPKEMQELLGDKE